MENPFYELEKSIDRVRAEKENVFFEDINDLDKYFDNERTV